MTEITRPKQHFADINSSLSDGDCEADPVPALWYEDEDDMYSESGFIERFWLPLSIAVFAGWGSLSFVLVNSFGWLVILAIVGVVAAGVAGAVVLVKAGDRNQVEAPASHSVPSAPAETAERQYRNAA